MDDKTKEIVRLIYKKQDETLENAKRFFGLQMNETFSNCKIISKGFLEEAEQELATAMALKDLIKDVSELLFSEDDEK